MRVLAGSLVVQLPTAWRIVFPLPAWCSQALVSCVLMRLAAGLDRANVAEALAASSVAWSRIAVLAAGFLPVVVPALVVGGLPCVLPAASPWNGAEQLLLLSALTPKTLPALPAAAAAAAVVAVA